MAFGMLALTVAALFTSAAFYVSFAEHPARSGARRSRPAHAVEAFL